MSHGFDECVGVYSSNNRKIEILSMKFRPSRRLPSEDWSIFRWKKALNRSSTRLRADDPGFIRRPSSAPLQRSAISTRNIHTYVLANDPNIFVKESRVEYLQQGVASNRVRNSNGAVCSKAQKGWFATQAGQKVVFECYEP